MNYQTCCRCRKKFPTDANYGEDERIICEHCQDLIEEGRRERYEDMSETEYEEE